MRNPRTIRNLVWILLAVIPAVSAQTWQYERNSNPLGDGHIAIANAQLQGVTPMVRCWTAQSELDVRFAVSVDGGMLSSDQVVVRFDSKAPITMTWPRNATGHALVVPFEAQRELLAGLRHANHLELSVRTGNDRERLLQIPLDGSARAINQAIRDCQ